MFDKLFNFKKKDAAVAAPVFKSVMSDVLVEEKKDVQKQSKYPEVVERIHNEFNTAGEKLLCEAQAILERESAKDVSKGKRLKAIGFRNVAQVAEAEDSIRAEQKASLLAKTILHYKERYPLQKFITEDNVNVICQKYGLVWGGVDLFKGFVPEKNLKDVEQFKIKDEDKDNRTIYQITDVSFSRSATDTEKFNVTKILDSICNQFQRSGYDEYDFRRNLSEAGVSAEDCSKVTSVRSYSSEYSDFNKKLSICAPAKDMDLTGKTIIKNRVSEKVKFHIHDPVVLQSVRGGYLIVTAWGDEASDPLIANEINN